MVMKSILELFGMYSVDEDYTRSIDEKLKKIEEDFNTVNQVSDTCDQIVNALIFNDRTKAVNVALNFCKIDDEVKELQRIRREITENGSTVENALSSAKAKDIVKEIVTSTRKEIKDNSDKITELIPNIASAGNEMNEKFKNLKTATTAWSLKEKLG